MPGLPLPISFDQMIDLRDTIVYDALIQAGATLVEQLRIEVGDHLFDRTRLDQLTDEERGLATTDEVTAALTACLTIDPVDLAEALIRIDWIGEQLQATDRALIETWVANGSRARKATHYGPLRRRGPFVPVPEQLRIHPAVLSIILAQIGKNSDQPFALRIARACIDRVRERVAEVRSGQVTNGA